MKNIARATLYSVPDKPRLGKRPSIFALPDHAEVSQKLRERKLHGASHTNIRSVNEANEVENQQHWNKPPVDLPKNCFALRIGKIGEEIGILCSQDTIVNMFVELRATLLGLRAVSVGSIVEST